MTDESSASSQQNITRDAWHERVLAALSDCGVHTAPRYPVVNYILAIAVLAGSIGLVSLVVYGIEKGPSARWERDILAWIGYPPLIIFVIFALSRVRNLLLRRAWQSSARTAEDEVLRNTSRRPVLYLRSFALDEHLAKPSWGERFLGLRPFANAEQIVTSELRKLGPVIAIGRPGEKLPALGAARFYVAHDRWQEKVEALVKESQLVLWATGETEGLRWELSHLVSNLEPSRIVLWAHPSLIPGGYEKREQAWRKFRETLGSIFPKPLPTTLGNARFFSFDKDWTPIPHAATSWGILVPRHVSALRQTVTIPPNQHPYLWLAWDISRILVGIVVTIGIGLFATRDIGRKWDLGVVHPVDFWIGAIALGSGVAMLAAGIAALCKRRLKAVWAWSIVPAVAALSWLAVAMIASPGYWWPVEADVWTRFSKDPSLADEYLSIPRRFRRIDAYPLIVERRRKEVLLSPEGTSVYYRFDDLIEEIEERSKNNLSLVPVKDALLELQTMSSRPENLRDLPPKYFELWTKYLETTNEQSNSDKIRLARKILQEASYALPDDADSKILRLKLQALTSDGYPQLAKELLLKTLRNPYDLNFDIRRELEQVLQEVTAHPQSDANLSSVKATLLEVKAMLDRSSDPRDSSPAYFHAWTKHLEASTELSAIEKSRRAERLLEELRSIFNASPDIEALRPRLYEMANNLNDSPRGGPSD